MSRKTISHWFAYVIIFEGRTDNGQTVYPVVREDFYINPDPAHFATPLRAMMETYQGNVIPTTLEDPEVSIPVQFIRPISHSITQLP